jgi:acetyl-CoA acyltransferase
LLAGSPSTHVTMSESSAYIVAIKRSAVGRAGKGLLRHARPEDMAAQVIRGLLDGVPDLPPDQVDDVLIGCAMPEGSQGLNVGRTIALKAGLPDSVPAATINRFCSSGLQTIAMASQAILAGHADVIVAGGVESMSQVPMTGFHYQPDPDMLRADADVFVSMGNTAENVAEHFGVSRADQDAFALRSHERALAAVGNGVFAQEIIPLRVRVTRADAGAVRTEEVTVDRDEGPRADSTLEALSRLPAVFRAGGSVTAGNSSQMSDGAAVALVVSEKALKAYGLTPMARLVGFAVAGVAPELMGIGPIEAVPKVLARTGIALADIGRIELNEAFASQALAVVRQLGMDIDRVNVHGGAIALGHPLGATGAKLSATLQHEMQREGQRYGLCTMCICGGMGAAGLFENLAS